MVSMSNDTASHWIAFEKMQTPQLARNSVDDEKFLDGQVQFSDANGRPCLVVLNQKKQLDLYIDGRQVVQNLSNIRAESNCLHFEGQRLFMSRGPLQVAEDATSILVQIVALKPTAFEDRALRLLERGQIRILSAKWLLERPEGYLLQRCQDLPREAFVPPKKAGLLFKYPCFLVVLSYTWLSEEHPDPSGFHFHNIQLYLAKHSKHLKHQSKGDPRLQGLPDLQDLTDHNDFGLFWDWGSLPQKGRDRRRTAHETRTFKQGLDVMALLYGSANTVILMQTAMPDVPFNISLNLEPYRKRGWCNFEACVANIVKPGALRMDIGQDAAMKVLADDDATWLDLGRAASKSRDPIYHPEVMRKELEQLSWTNGADCSVVAQKYEEFFYQAAATGKELFFMNLSSGVGWDDADMEQLSRSLPAFVRGRTLGLVYQAFSDRGLAAVVQQLPKMEFLVALNFLGCTNVSGIGFQALAGRQLPALRDLCLSRTALDDDGLCTLAQQSSCFPELRLLRFSGCRGFGALGIAAFAKCLPAKLEAIYLGESAIDDEGLKAFAQGLAALENLNCLDLRNCERLGVSGLAALSVCLPKLPAMRTAQADGQCRICCRELDPPWISPFSFWICWSCGEALTLGDVVHACSCNFVCCDECRRGALWLPQRLEQTPQGQELAQVWSAGGRDLQQLRWCRKRENLVCSIRSTRPDVSPTGAIAPALMRRCSSWGDTVTPTATDVSERLDMSWRLSGEHQLIRRCSSWA